MEVENRKKGKNREEVKKAIERKRGRKISAIEYEKKGGEER